MSQTVMFTCQQQCPKGLTFLNKWQQHLELLKIVFSCEGTILNILPFKDEAQTALFKDPVHNAQ
jgi:hypothetical protein